MASFNSRHAKDLNRLLEEAAKGFKNRLDKHFSGIILVYMFADWSKECIAQSPFQSCFPVIFRSKDA